MVPPSSLSRKSVIAAVFGDKNPAFFWEERFLPRWLPLLLGLGLGIFLAFLIVQDAWHFLVPVALVVPTIALFSHYPFVAVMAWMLLLPYFLNEATSAGRAIYWILHRAMIPGTLGIVIFADWLGIKKRKESTKLGSAELAILVFLGLALANIFLWNRSPVQTTIRFYDRLFVPFCMYGLVRLIAPSGKDLKRVLWAAFITLIIQGVISLISWFAPQALPPRWADLAGSRTVGSFGNVAVYTSTLLFLALLLFQHAMNCRSMCIRYLLLATFGLAVFFVFFSFSRGSWLGCLTVLGGMLLIYPKTMIRLMIIISVLAYVLGSSILADEVAFGNERLTSEESQRSGNSRVIVHNALILMIEAKPFFGWGYDNHLLYTQQFLTRVGNISATLGYGISSHNTYLTFMAELGVIGLLLYICPAGWWLMLSIKVRRRLPQEGFQSWRLLVMLWLLLLHMFIVTNFMDMARTNPFGTTVWWMALGLIANMVNTHLRPGDTGAPGWARRAIERA